MGSKIGGKYTLDDGKITIAPGFDAEYSIKGKHDFGVGIGAHGWAGSWDPVTGSLSVVRTEPTLLYHADTGAFLLDFDGAGGRDPAALGFVQTGLGMTIADFLWV